jgi:hypothetical protein
VELNILFSLEPPDILGGTILLKPFQHRAADSENLAGERGFARAGGDLLEMIAIDSELLISMN